MAQVSLRMIPDAAAAAASRAEALPPSKITGNVLPDGTIKAKDQMIIPDQRIAMFHAEGNRLKPS